MAAPDVFSWGADKAVRVKQGQMGRPMPWGDNWTRIRVGMLFGCEDTGGGLAATYDFVLGLASGSTNWWYEAMSTYCVAARHNSATMDRVTVPRTGYSITAAAGGGWLTSKRIANAVTDCAGGYHGTWSAGGPTISATDATPYGFFWELDRVTEVANVITTSNHTVMGANNFMDVMSCPTMSSAPITGYAVRTGRVMALTPAAGPLDHVFFGATTSLLYTYISKLAVAKVL